MCRVRGLGGLAELGKGQLSQPGWGGSDPDPSPVPLHQTKGVVQAGDGEHTWP